MISEELLSEILDTEVKAVELWDNNTIRYFAPKDYIINIYELAHKCKEWAKEKNYSLLSGYDEGEISCYVNVNFIYRDDGEFSTTDWDIEKIFEAATEVEAILAACEWILKETK